MIKGLYTAYTGMVNEQKRLDVLTNNLANADTNGYKKEGTTSQTFADELAIKIKDTSSYGLNKKLGVISMGVHLGETYTNYDQGSIKVTDNETDVALAGNGFFAIAFTNKAGETSGKYTRDGAFTVNTEGYLVTKDGDYVLNQAVASNRFGVSSSLPTILYTFPCQWSCDCSPSGCFLSCLAPICADTRTYSIPPCAMY